jgi:hypothetical protein
MAKGYRLLKVIGVVFKVFGVIVLAAGLITFIIVLIGGGEKPETPKAASVIWLIAGIIQCMFFVMFSEIIKVLTKIEQNTRPKEGN